VVDRREFMYLSVLFGAVTALNASASFASAFKQINREIGDYKGKLRTAAHRLVSGMDDGSLSPEQFMDGMAELYEQIRLADEFKPWIEEIADRNGGYSILYKDESAKRWESMELYFLPANSSAPPHGHHDIASSQFLLSGGLTLRQYDRIHILDDDHVALKFKRELAVTPEQGFLMTEWRDNIHWFSTSSQPALLFNCQASRLNCKRFDPNADVNAKRDYIDPTGTKLPGGLIAAKHISKAEAHAKFEKVNLNNFPV
jgi:hypothetical protein